MSNNPTWGEFGFIAELLTPHAGTEALNLADDAAQFSPPAGYDVIISTDALVESVHFPNHADPALVARRTLACNISDLAAKGAQPIGCFMTLGVAPHWDAAWLRGFAEAFGAGLTHWGLSLWGGDTVSAPTPFVSLTVHGLVPHDALGMGKMIKRDGAQIGDEVYVTGTIGDGWLALADLSAPYSDPRPPLHFGQGLIDLAHSSLDVSDGLMADLDHLCRASGCAIELDAAAIPLSEAGQAYLVQSGEITKLVSGGDDLQIAFTAAPDKADALQQLAGQCGTLLTRIGKVVPAQNDQFGAVLRGDNGAPIKIERRGYSHF